VKDERKAKREDNKIKTWNFLRIFFSILWSFRELCLRDFSQKKKEIKEERKREWRKNGHKKGEKI
jgi:hypothetical protein